MAEKRLIGIDIGGTTTKIALLTNDGAIIEKCVIQTPFEIMVLSFHLPFPVTVNTLLEKHLSN